MKSYYIEDKTNKQNLNVYLIPASKGDANNLKTRIFWITILLSDVIYLVMDTRGRHSVVIRIIFFLFQILKTTEKVSASSVIVYTW